MIIKMIDRFWRNKLDWAGRRCAGLTARFLLQGKKLPTGGSRSDSDEHVRHRQPHSRVLQPHSFQLRVTTSSVVILSSTVLELTSSGILMASFDMEASYPTADCDAEALASWFAADRKHMVCVTASATGEKHTRAPAEAKPLQLKEECWNQAIMTQLSYLWEWRYLSQTKKQPPAVVLTAQTKRERGRNYCECKNTDRTVAAALNEAERGPWDLQTPCYNVGWKWKRAEIRWISLFSNLL